MQTIPLNHGYAAMVADVDYERVDIFRWHVQHPADMYYAVHSPGLMLHRYILHISDPRVVICFKDGNGLNCQRDNLEVLTRSEAGHRFKLYSTNKSGYRGVAHLGTGKYRAMISVSGERIYLGGFDDPVAAAKAFDLAARKYFGQLAVLNFPD